MPLVPALCPQCGATLEVNPDSEAAVCKFCNTPFITEKAVTNYNVSYNTTNVSNNTTVNNISNSEVHIHQNSEDAQTMLEKIKAQLKRGNTDVAYNKLEKLQEMFPEDYRTDEAELLYELNIGVDYISRSDYKIPALSEKLFALSQSNREVAKKYAQQIQEETNEYINSKLNTAFSGGLYFYKLVAANFPEVFSNFKNALNNSYKNYQEIISGEWSLDKDYTRTLIFNLTKNTNEAFDKLSAICYFFAKGKYKNLTKIKIDNDLHGYDDEFCHYIIQSSNKYAEHCNGIIEEINDFFGSNEISYTISDEDIFEQLNNSTLKLMTADGAKIYKQKLAEEAEKKQRAAQEEHERKIARMTARYKELLAAGKTKDAFAFLEQNDFLADKNAEMKKFRKTLFGYKYQE